MRKRKWLFLTIITIFCYTIIPGCWNYREIDKLIVVAGVAIDKGANGQYLITVEAIQIEGGADAKTTSKQLSIQGKTIFDAVRNEISLSGKKLYWSHTKVVILSKEVAKEGIIKFLDWFQRDSETRADINILVSDEKTAKEIIAGKHLPQKIISLELEEMLQNQKSLSKAPVIEIWKVINDIESPGIVAILPVVTLKGESQKIMGTAIFHKDKLIGFLNGVESQNLLFIKNEIKGGLLIAGENDPYLSTPISLEIFKSTTKTEPIIKGDDITFNIKIQTTLALDEIAGEENYMDERKLGMLKKNVEKMLNTRVENLIKQIQSSYGVDVFGFGAKIREEHPRKWRKFESTWEERFEDVKVNVTSKVSIKGSGMMAEPLKIGD